MNKNLFGLTNFASHSGIPLKWKIDCDALTDEDIETLAFIISEQFKFRSVYGVPTGGTRLAKALEKYCSKEALSSLLIDDVLTTGKTMEEARKSLNATYTHCVVIFARGECPEWVTPIFTLTENFR